jgi:UDP-glucose 4-epimerase
MGEYWRVRVDDRDLNYDKYLTEGDREASTTADYTSATTQRLSVDEIIAKLAAQPEVEKELHGGSGSSFFPGI